MRFKNFLKLIVATLPFAGTFAKAAIHASEPSQRAPVARWSELRDNLVNMRMPQAYYDLLTQSGVRDLSELYLLKDGELKRKLLDMYQEDLIIMAGSDKTRSIF